MQEGKVERQEVGGCRHLKIAGGGGQAVGTLGSREVRKLGSEEERKAGREVGVGETGGGGPCRPYIYTKS